nr:FkbM family methyltransferase [Pontibacter litorisediminis]
MFSQTGEDVILSALLTKPSHRQLFYIDVGCNDPVLDSNTFLIYLEGGSGICIDANDSLIQKFNKVRPRDIAVCSAVSDVEQDVTFFLSNESRVSTVDKNTLAKHSSFWSFDNQQIMAAKTLNTILKEHLPAEQEIDLLSIDVEGHDFNVLKSIDLNLYKPKIIILEMHGLALNCESLKSNATVQYLKANGYTLRFYASVNAYFQRIN